MVTLILGAILGITFYILFTNNRRERPVKKKKQKTGPRLIPGFDKIFYCPSTFTSVSAYTEEYSEGPCYYCGADYIRGHQHYRSFSYRVWSDGEIYIRVPVWVVNSNPNIDWTKLTAYDVKKLVNSGTQDTTRLRILLYSEDDFKSEETFVPLGESTNVEI